MMDERPQAADNSPSLASPAMKGPKSEDSGASIAAGAQGGDCRATGWRTRLSLWPLHVRGRDREPRARGQRAIRAGAASAATLRPELSTAKAPLSPAFRRPRPWRRKPSADAVPPIANAAAPAPIAPRAGAPPSNRASLTRAAAHEAARSGRKPEVSAPPPVARAREFRLGPRASGIERQGGRRSAARSDHLRTRRQRRKQSVRRAALGAFRRRGVVPTRRLDDKRRDAQTSRPARARSPLAPRPRLRRSARSTSIFRPEASRMSR